MKHSNFQQFSRRDKLLAKRRPFYEICSKDRLFIKVLQMCGLFLGWLGWYWYSAYFRVISHCPALVKCDSTSSRTNSSASISACDNVCVCQTKPIVNIPVKHNREIPSGTLCYLRTLRPVILLLPLLQDKWMRCRSCCIAMQRTIWRNGTTSLRTAPYPRCFEPTPSSHIKPGLRRRKCRCCPSRCSLQDCRSSTVGRPPGFAQKTATSNQGGSHIWRSAGFSWIFNRSYRSPNLTKTPIIQSPNTSPLTYDHLPFVGKRMHREVPETQPVCQPVCPPERLPPGLGPLVVDLIICGVNGDAGPQGVPLQGVSHHLPKHDEARHGSRRIKAGWVGWVGWSPVGHAVATCWSSALGNVAAGLETNRCVERQPVLDGPVPPQGFFQGLAAEVTQAAFVTLQKVELKKNLTVRICEDLWRSVKGNAIKCAARYSLYWTLSATVEIAWAKPSWLQDQIWIRRLHWCLSTTGLLSRHQPQPGCAQRTMADSETTPKLLLPKVVSCSRRMLTPSHWVHSCVHSIWKQRRHSLWYTLHHLTPSYTSTGQRCQSQPHNFNRLQHLQQFGKSATAPALPIKAPLPGRGFRRSRLTIWLVAKAWQWHAMTTYMTNLWIEIELPMDPQNIA